MPRATMAELSQDTQELDPLKQPGVLKRAGQALSGVTHGGGPGADQEALRAAFQEKRGQRIAQAQELWKDPPTPEALGQGGNQQEDIVAKYNLNDLVKMYGG